MKYLILIIFNLVAFYILAVFVLGNGGILDTVRKAEAIYKLEQDKMSREIEVEELKSRWNHLRSLTEPDNTTLAGQGKKNENIVIFKFIGKDASNPAQAQNDLRFTIYRIYFSVALAAGLLLFGNIILCYRLKKGQAR